MVFALSGAVWIECQYCQAACLSSCRWIPGLSCVHPVPNSYSSPCLNTQIFCDFRFLWLQVYCGSFCLLFYAVFQKWKEIIAILHKPISTDLMMHGRPYTIVLMPINSWIQKHNRGLSLFKINQRGFRLKALYLIPLNKHVQFHSHFKTITESLFQSPLKLMPLFLL